MTKMAMAFSEERQQAGESSQPVVVVSPFRRLLASPLTKALASAVLLYLCFFPLNWGWLGWLAIVPLLSVVAQKPQRESAEKRNGEGVAGAESSKRRSRRPFSVSPFLRFAVSPLGAAWLGGLAFAVPALQWLRLGHVSMYATWIGLSLFLSLHFLLFVWFTRRLTLIARVPLIVAAPAIWTALEFLRARLDIGFAWYMLGHTQHEFLALIQIADLFGAYGVSFLVMTVNVVLFHVGTAGVQRLGSKTPAADAARRGLLVAAALLAATLAYGWFRLTEKNALTEKDTLTEIEGPRVALIQGNVPQFVRNDPDENTRVANHFVDLADRAAREQPDLIVWSETSFIANWRGIASDYAGTVPADWQEGTQETKELAKRAGKRWRTPSLLGLEAGILEVDRPRAYNSALLLDADGTELGRYDKMYLIPFGEYVPWVNTLPFMKWLSPYDYDYSVWPGTRYTVLETPPGKDFRRYSFAVLICYEDTVPHFAPRFLRHPDGGRPPDFFLNISNDGWFKGSEEHEQHMVGSRFRAIECRRAVARAVNMGVSGVIDGNGRVVALPGSTWSESKNRAAVVVASIPIDRRESLYVRWGDALPVLCLLLCGLGLGWSFIRRRPQALIPG